MVTVVRSATFDQWIRGLRDRRAVARIAMRLQRVESTGNLGDARSVGNGVSELRIYYGPRLPLVLHARQPDHDSPAMRR